MTHTTHAAGGHRRASVTPLVAICLVAIIGFVALAVDGGLLLTDRRQAQTVADGAALAAAADLYANWSKNQGLDPKGTAAASALSVAAANGYSNDGTTSAVTVNVPPTSGPYTGTKGYAEVIVHYYQSRGFSKIYGSGNITVSARSVARGRKPPPSPALLVLDPSVQQALEFEKCLGYLDVTGGTICVDSSHSVAAHWEGGSNVNGQILAEEVDIHGGTNHPDYFVTAPTAGNVNTGAPTVADPLSGLPVPNPATLPNQYTTAPSGVVTLSPGLYNGGLSVSGGTITMNPGVYYLKGGTFSQSGGSITGTGVFIYAEGAFNQSGGTCTLTAPGSGTYKGIQFFAARSGPAVNWSGSGSVSLGGTVYAPGSAVNYSASGNVTVGGQLICNTLDFSGSGTLTVKGTGGSSNRDIRLVE